MRELHFLCPLNRREYRGLPLTCHWPFKHRIRPIECSLLFVVVTSSTWSTNYDLSALCVLDMHKTFSSSSFFTLCYRMENKKNWNTYNICHSHQNYILNTVFFFFNRFVVFCLSKNIILLYYYLACNVNFISNSLYYCHVWDTKLNMSA